MNQKLLPCVICGQNKVHVGFGYELLILANEYDQICEDCYQEYQQEQEETDSDSENKINSLQNNELPF